MAFNLTELAIHAMKARGFLPTFSNAIHHELNHMQKAAPSSTTRDMRDKLWFSIDNDDSEDLDQLSYVEVENKYFKVFVAIADVEALVQPESAIDSHAAHNTTSVYTPTIIFSMLPEKLSTNLTSLNEGVDRTAMVVEMEVFENGEIGRFDIYPAFVRNHAKLAYNSVGNWLETEEQMPKALEENEALRTQVLHHHTVTEKMSSNRIKKGMLSLETVEARAIIKDHIVVDIVEVRKNPARMIIENFMVAANECATKFLRKHHFPVFQRVVRIPKKWDRIVELAAERGFKLPNQPNSKLLEQFLKEEKEKDPLRFPDLSLAVIKLLGRGEYVVQQLEDSSLGHFGLALRNYSHSTAPNRRYPDLITQRLLKAALNKQPVPYSLQTLQELAAHCTAKQADAEKVSRQMQKSAAALVLSKDIGKTFRGLITGAGTNGTWVRIFHPPAEGKVTRGTDNLKVGDRIQAQLLAVDVLNGHIDFAKV